MAVEMKRTKKEAAAPAAEAAPATKQHQVMLGNGCKRYAFKGIVYESGIKYNVTAAKRTELFGRSDENGVRYFYDAAVLEAAAKRAVQRKRKQMMPVDLSAQQMAAIMVDVANEEGDEAVTIEADGNDRPEVADAGNGELDTAGDSVAV